jgi:hypothetical protein
MVLVQRAELEGIKRAVTRALKVPFASAANWAFAWLGIGVAGILALLSSVAVHGNHVKSWVIVSEVGFIVVGLFLAIFCGVIAHKQRGQVESERTQCH